MRTRWPLAALACLLVAGSLLVAPGAVASRDASKAVPMTSSKAGPRWRAVITFDKSPRQFDSRVVWRLQQRQAAGWRVVETRSWRAGAGLPGRGGRDACARDRGWLPNGSYRIRQYDDYPGNVIKGRAFRVDDKACGNGTVRRQLFIHTEQGPRSRQCRDRRGDQACRWEWPRINDYRSNGCIKMAPRDLAELVRLYQRRFRPGVRYAADQVVLRVIS